MVMHFSPSSFDYHATAFEYEIFVILCQSSLLVVYLYRVRFTLFVNEFGLLENFVWLKDDLICHTICR